MSVLDYPVYFIDPLYRVDLRYDGVMRWTWETMLRKTDDYVFFINPYPVSMPGFYRTELADENIKEAMKCLN